MNLLELKDKIKSHLTAGYPGLFIHSGEEARVDTMLQDVAAQLQLHPKEWNLGYGWVDFFHKQPRDSQPGKTDLADSLPSLLDDDLDNKLFIIKDARSALENQPLAVARLKQLLNRIQRHHRGKAAVVLVSETLHIPSQIEAQITLLPLPLPRGEEISDQLEAVCQQLDLLVPEALRQRLHAACSGLNQEEIRSALAMVRQQHEQVSDTALALIQHEKEQIIAKSGVLEMLRVNENAADIGGLENLKAWLSRRAQIFRRLGEAREARVQAPKGVLIAGMPGCGKSLTAKAAAGLFQLPLLRLDIGSLLGKYVGESEHNMRRALSMAESVSPCILWIDELEKAFVGMNSGSGSEVSSRLFGYFLTWMQEKTGAVFVIATANNITALPPELLRKGRFDEVFYVGFPNAVERGAILDIHLKGEAVKPEGEHRSKLVTQCRDYAGADIQNAINEARETAFLDNRAMTFDDLERAIDMTVPLRETLREQVAKYEELFEKLKLKPASASDGLSVAQMIQMADSHNALRREEVARHEDCPDDVLEKLVNDTDAKVRTAVYGNPNCPEKLLTLRINIEEGQPGFDLALLHIACLHAHAPHDLIAAQFERLKLDAEQRLQLARRTGEEALQRRLIADEEYRVRRELAINKAVGKTIQHQLAKDPVIAVRDYLISTENLHPDVQEQLARDSSFEVRESLARRDELSESVLMLLARDEDQDVLEALARRKGAAALPDTVQLELVKCNAGVRETLASNDNLGAPSWWTRLTTEEWTELLADEPDEVVGELTIRCTNSVIPVGKGLPAVVRDKVELLISTSEESQPKELLLTGGSCGKVPTSLPAGPNGTTSHVDRLPSSHKAPMSYKVSADGCKPASVRVISLASWKPRILVTCRLATKLSPPRKPRKNSAAMDWETSLSLPGSGRYELQLHLAPGASLGKVEGLPDDATEFEEQRETIEPRQVGENEYLIEVEADGKYQLDIAFTEAGEQVPKACRVYLTCEEAKEEGCRSEFERLIKLNRRHLEKFDIKAVVHLDRNARSSSLQSWVLEDQNVSNSFRPLVIADDYASRWAPPDWDAPHGPVLSNGRFLHDPRPEATSFQPPKGFIEARQEIARYIRGSDDQSGLLESAPLGAWLSEDSGFRSLVEDYLGAFMSWLDADPGIACWIDTIAVCSLEPDGRTLGRIPDAIILSPLHPLRLAWHCFAQKVLRDEAEGEAPCPAASILDPDCVPDLLTISLQAPGGVDQIDFLSVECSSDYWSVLWNGSRLGQIPDRARRAPFDSSFGLAVGGISSGFSPAHPGQGYAARASATQSPPSARTPIPIAWCRATRQTRSRVPAVQDRCLRAWVLLA